MSIDMKDPSTIPTIDYVGWSVHPHDPRLKSKGNGNRLILPVFVETITATMFKDGHRPMYTMREIPVFHSGVGEWLPSAKMIYVMSDSEYEAGIKLFGSFEHFQLFMGTEWFMNGTNGTCTGLLEWRETQELRKKADAEKVLMEQALAGNVQAAKIIYEGKHNKKRGRPSKQELEDAINREASKVVDFEKHLERIREA